MTSATPPPSDAPKARKAESEGPLASWLREQIATGGPMPVDVFMGHCLYHPRWGYYHQGAILGRAGDFITAPEISQLFGELIGIWCLLVWRQLGRPQRLRLAELGPGRGTLMADLLRASRIAPDFAKALEVDLIEISAPLMAEQRKVLTGAAVRVRWSTQLTPALHPTIVIANEFLDAIPVAQFVHERADKNADGSADKSADEAADGGTGEAADEGSRSRWRTRLVDWNSARGFHFVMGPQVAMEAETPALPPGMRVFQERDDIPEGAILESRWRALVGGGAAEAKRSSDRGPARAAGLAHQLAAAAEAAPLVALFIDYGHEGPLLGETLQAVRGHAYAPVLANPGAADLSAHVDFTELAAALARVGLASHGPMSQAAFLAGLGLPARLEALLAAASPEEANALESGAHRLMAPAGMGGRFKVLAVASDELPPPPLF